MTLLSFVGLVLPACADVPASPGDTLDPGSTGTPTSGSPHPTPTTGAEPHPTPTTGAEPTSATTADGSGSDTDDGTGDTTIAATTGAATEGTSTTGETSEGATDTTSAAASSTGVSSTGADGVCGDNMLDPGEGCDDGPDNGPGQPCNASCQPPECGDGDVDFGEQCDDGPANADTNSCTADCTHNVCGDGKPGPAEQCDDGDSNDEDACTGECVAQKALAIAPGWEHTCALLSGGKVKCWGSGDNRLGWQAGEYIGDEPGEMGDALPSINLGTGNTAEVVRAGAFHTCAILQQGTLKCWGSASYLGLEQPPGILEMVKAMGDALPLVDLGTGAVAVDLQLGWQHTCVLLAGGTVKCFGISQYGQLGYGDMLGVGVSAGTMGDDLATVDLGAGAEVAQIAVGFTHSCALLTTGRVKCWGRNQFGELGLGDTEHRGDEPGEMGDALPAIDLGAGAKAVQIAAGGAHVCALLESGAIKCWGDNDQGQVGIGSQQLRIGDAPGEMGDPLPAVDLGAVPPVVAISAGSDASCAVFTDHTAKCWGSNTSGMLGLGDNKNRGLLPGEMGDALPRIDLGAGKQIAALWRSAGGHSLCATFTDDTAKCWGQNHFGQLGLGDKVARGSKPEHMGDNLPTLKLFHDGW